MFLHWSTFFGEIITKGERIPRSSGILFLLDIVDSAGNYLQKLIHNHFRRKFSASANATAFFSWIFFTLQKFSLF